MRPNSLIVQSYMSRGGRLWLTTRASLSFVLLLAGTDPLQLSALAIAEIIMVSVAVSFLDTERHHEGAFLANLGVGMVHVGGLFAGAALIGEVLLWLAGAVVR